MSRRAASLIGFSAVLMWSALGYLTVASGRMPPFQLAAIAFAIGGALGAAAAILRGRAIALVRQPAAVWALGVGGLFGYHALYFSALRLAPPAEAGLVNYLWPLLVVLFSALLPEGGLRPHHLAGALLGFAGTAVLLAGRGHVVPGPNDIAGLAAALVAAFVWAIYSVASRRFGTVPTECVAGFCLATALLALVMHVAVESTWWPDTLGQWAAILALGIGPVGAAFYAWDIGVKRGDIRVLGAWSYAAPVLSTALLVGAGLAPWSPSLTAGAVMIAGGGLLAWGLGSGSRSGGR